MITIVIAARNAAGTIEATLGSVVRQTSHAWRAVVVDERLYR